MMSGLNIVLYRGKRTIRERKGEDSEVRSVIDEKKSPMV